MLKRKIHIYMKIDCLIFTHTPYTWIYTSICTYATSILTYRPKKKPLKLPSPIVTPATVAHRQLAQSMRLEALAEDHSSATTIARGRESQ